MNVAPISMNTKGALAQSTTKNQSRQYASTVNNSADTFQKSISFGSISKEVQDLIDKTVAENFSKALKEGLDEKKAKEVAESASKHIREILDYYPTRKPPVEETAESIEETSTMMNDMLFDQNVGWSGL